MVDETLELLRRRGAPLRREANGQVVDLAGPITMRLESGPPGHPPAEEQEERRADEEEVDEGLPQERPELGVGHVLVRVRGDGA